MSSRCKTLIAGMIVAGVMAAPAIGAQRAAAPGAPDRPALRVCADPNNLPFSNDRKEGFENALAELVAADLGRVVRYTWWPQRRGFARNTLRAGLCDVIMGIPASYEPALPTRPYYRSTYVFVTRRDRRLRIRSFDDPALRRATIGVHVIGDDYASVPPAQALASRGIVRNIRGYSIYGDYSKPNPPAALIEAVASGEIDVAVAWGPLAGFFATRERVPLAIQPVSPPIDRLKLPFVYDIAMGVRRDDTALRDALNRVITRRRAEIASLLGRFGVPLVAAPTSLRRKPHATRSGSVQRKPAATTSGATTSSGLP